MRFVRNDMSYRRWKTGYGTRCTTPALRQIRRQADWSHIRFHAPAVWMGIYWWHQRGHQGLWRCSFHCLRHRRTVHGRKIPQDKNLPRRKYHLYGRTYRTGNLLGTMRRLWQLYSGNYGWIMSSEPLCKESHERSLRRFTEREMWGFTGNPLCMESDIWPVRYPAAFGDNGNYCSAKRLDYRYGKPSAKDGPRTPGHEKIIYLGHRFYRYTQMVYLLIFYPDNLRSSVSKISLLLNYDWKQLWLKIW